MHDICLLLKEKKKINSETWKWIVNNFSKCKYEYMRKGEPATYARLFQTKAKDTLNCT